MNVFSICQEHYIHPQLHFAISCTFHFLRESETIEDFLARLARNARNEKNDEL